MIAANSLPKSPLRAADASQSPEKTAVRTAAATQHILTRQPPETDRDITMDPIDRPRSEPDKTPQPESSSKRNDGNTVRNHALRRRHSVFAAEQMDLMSELPQTFGGLEQIPFSSTVTIQALMNEGDLHQVFLTSMPRENLRTSA